MVWETIDKGMSCMYVVPLSQNERSLQRRQTDPISAIDAAGYEWVNRYARFSIPTF